MLPNHGIDKKKSKAGYIQKVMQIGFWDHIADLTMNPIPIYPMSTVL